MRRCSRGTLHLLIAAVVGFTAAGCASPAVPAREDDRRKALCESLETHGPQADRTRALMALLGNEAAEVLLKADRDSLRPRATEAIVTLAWQGLVPAELLPALAELGRDADPAVRRNVRDTLFWMSVDPSTIANYWPPEETETARVIRTHLEYWLPVREAARRWYEEGAPLPGRPTADEAVEVPWRKRLPEAARFAHEQLVRMGEEAPTQEDQLGVLIQLARARHGESVRTLISFLEPAPGKELDEEPTRDMRERAWRCLSELTGRKTKRWDDWVEWWKAR